jgi:MGT family glycosyltransferase
MYQHGHLQRLLPLVSGLSARGLTAHVFTHRSFRDHVEASGGRFVDLFADHSLQEADPTSVPAAYRYVSFAGRFAGDVATQVARLRPALVVHDSFAIIGHVVGRRLEVPHVNVCAGHDVHPARLPELLASVPTSAPSQSCLQAAGSLSEELEVAYADPFSYLCTPSPFLNIYCEPPEFLSPAQRAAFEPVAFFGSVDPARGGARAASASSSFPEGPTDSLKVYVSFGTVNWRHRAAEVGRALRSIAEDLGTVPHVRALISLGGHQEAGDMLASTLMRSNVHVAHYVDQWRILQEADVFLTHHGLNSTHEAIYHRVPMVSYPFLWDQPALARRCRELGLAVPLSDTPRGALPAGRVCAVLARVRDARAALTRRLETARRWEDRVIAGRPAVIQQILDLL